MSKLNVLVEDLTPEEFKCINTIIMEKLKPADLPYTKENSGWHYNNLETWKRYQNEKDHFNFISVKDFTEEDKQNPTIYLITVPFVNDHLNTTWVRWLPDLTLNLLKENNIPIVLSQPHEYFLGHIKHFAYHHFYPSDELSQLSAVLDQKGLHHNDIIIHGIAASSSNPGFITVGSRKVYEAYCYDYFKNGKRFFDDWSGHDVSHPTMARYKFLTVQDHIDSVDSKDKTSVCFNRQPRDLRCLLLLACEGQLDESVFTFLAEEPINFPMSNEDVQDRFLEILDAHPQTDYVKKLRQNITSVISRMPLELEELEGERVDHMNSNYALNQERKRAWFEMVTETHEWAKRDYAVFIITEKTLWPIIHNMPFCVQGHKENYHFLKELGFRLFENTLLNEEAIKRDLIHEELDQSLLYATEQMYERFNAWHKDLNFLQSCESDIKHNFNLLVETDWSGKEKNDLIKIYNHSKEQKTNEGLFLKNKFKF